MVEMLCRFLGVRERQRIDAWARADRRKRGGTDWAVAATVSASLLVAMVIAKIVLRRVRPVPA